MIIKLMKDGVLTPYPIALTADLLSKLDVPSTQGTEGQVLMLNGNLAPTWGNDRSEVFVGSDTPSGYSLYIEPGTGGIPSGNEVEY